MEILKSDVNITNRLKEKRPTGKAKKKSFYLIWIKLRSNLAMIFKNPASYVRSGHYKVSVFTEGINMYGSVPVV